MTLEASAFILTWITIGLLTLAVTGLIRQVRILSMQALRSVSQGHPELGSRLSNLPGTNEQKLRVLFYSDPACTVCRERLREFMAGVESLISTSSQMFVVVAGSASVPDAAEREVTAQTLENRQDLFQQLHVRATPFVAVISSDDVLLAARPLGSSQAVEQVLSLIRNLTAEEAHRDSLPG